MRIHRYFIPLAEDNTVVLAQMPKKTILRYLTQEYDKDKRGYNVIFEEIGRPVEEPSEVVYTFLEDGYKVSYPNAD